MKRPKRTRTPWTIVRLVAAAPTTTEANGTFLRCVRRFDHAVRRDQPASNDCKKESSARAYVCTECPTQRSSALQRNKQPQGNGQAAERFSRRFFAARRSARVGQPLRDSLHRHRNLANNHLYQPHIEMPHVNNETRMRLFFAQILFAQAIFGWKHIASIEL